MNVNRNPLWWIALLAILLCVAPVYFLLCALEAVARAWKPGKATIATPGAS